MSSNTWRQHFSNLASNEDGDRNMNSFGLALAAGNALPMKIKNLVEDIDSVFFVADDGRHIQPIHSPKNLGGTRTRIENKIVCLLGMGSKATAIILDFQKAMTDCNIITPTIDELVDCATKAEILALDCPQQPDQGATLEAVTFPGSFSFLPAPWLRDFILECDSLDPLELIPSVISEAKKFDENHEDDASFANKAVSHAEDFSLWAYGVGLGLIPETRFKINPEDGELRNFEKKRHCDCILPPIPLDGRVPTGGSSESSEVLSQLNVTMARQIEEAEMANNLRRKEIERMEEKEERKKDKLKDLHSSVHNMLSLASSVDCDETPSDPTSSCREFFNCKNASLAEQELVQQFEDLGLEDVGFAQGTSQALYHGLFQYYQGSSPSNFTIFAFYEEDPLQMDRISKRALLLTLVSTRGQGDTLEEIKSSAKQTVKVPTSYDGLYNQLSFFEGACAIFFGQESVPREKIRNFLKSMKKKKHTFKAAIVCDILFPAKVMYAIDIRMQRWLGECKRASDRCEVDDRIIDLSEIINDISNSRFFVELPPSFKSIGSTFADGDRARGRVFIR